MYLGDRNHISDFKREFNIKDISLFGCIAVYSLAEGPLGFVCILVSFKAK